MNEPEVPAAMSVEALDLFFDQIIQGLHAQPYEVRRLFHGRGRTYPGLEQITCDWIGQHLLVQVFRPVTPAFLNRLEAGLKSLPEEAKDAGILSIAIQHRYEQGAPTQLLVGEQPSRVEAVESGLKFYMNISANQNSGLFLDMRCGRDWVQKNSQGKNVLNLFAYTCGFSVAALAGGATQVVNVDMARGALNRGRENHQLNEQDTRKVKFLAHDIFKSWGKIKRLGPYDLIISDPPSFQKGSFALTKDYQKILRRLPDLLADNGEVMACANSPAVTSQFVIDGMQEHAPQLHYVKRLDNPEEFADVDSEANLKVQLFKKTSPEA